MFSAVCITILFHTEYLYLIYNSVRIHENNTKENYNALIYIYIYIYIYNIIKSPLNIKFKRHIIIIKTLLKKNIQLTFQGPAPSSAAHS